MNKTLECLNRAAQSAPFVTEAMRDALQDSSALMCHAIAPLIARAAELNHDIVALRNALSFDESVLADKEGAKDSTSDPECTRWNFDASDTALLVCRNDHDKGDDCNMEPMHPAEVLSVINSLRAAVLLRPAGPAK